MWIIIFSQKTMAFSLGVSSMKMAVLPSHLPNPFFLPRKTRAVGPTWESWHIAMPRGWTSNLLAAIRWAPCCTSWDMPLGWHMNKRDPTGRLVLVVIGCDDYSNPKKEVGWSWSDPTKKGDDNYLARFFFGWLMVTVCLINYVLYRFLILPVVLPPFRRSRGSMRKKLHCFLDIFRKSKDKYVEIHESRIQSGKEHNFDISSKGDSRVCQVGEIAAILELPRTFVGFRKTAPWILRRLGTWIYFFFDFLEKALQTFSFLCA